MSNLSEIMPEAAGAMTPDDLERFRGYLALLARLQVGVGLRDRLDLSGVVQQTLFEASREMAKQPRDRAEAETAAWLRSILSHNLADGLRKLAAQKRDVSRDRSLSAAIEESASRLGDWLAAQESSPSQKLIRREQAVRVSEAIEGLPENQRRAIEMHHLEGRPLAEVAEALNTTKAAVAGLLHRGLKSLRATLNDQ